MTLSTPRLALGGWHQETSLILKSSDQSHSSRCNSRHWDMVGTDPNRPQIKPCLAVQAHAWNATDIFINTNVMKASVLSSHERHDYFQRRVQSVRRSFWMSCTTLEKGSFWDVPALRLPLSGTCMHAHIRHTPRSTVHPDPTNFTVICQNDILTRKLAKLHLAYQSPRDLKALLLSFTVGRNAKCYGHFVRQFGSVLQN